MFEILRKSLLISIVSLFCCYQAIYAEKILYVKSQSEFEALSGSLRSQLDKIPQDGTETFTVYFSAGTYKFNQNLSFVNINRPNVSIHFTANAGQIVRFISAGNEYIPSEKTTETTTHYFVPLKGSYCRGEVFVDQNFNLVPISDSGDLSPKKINRAASRREKISQAATGEKYTIDYARFKLPQELSFLKNKDAAYFKNKLICFKLWFAQCYGTIVKTDNEYIYFYHSKSTMFDAIEASPSWDAWKGFPLFYITNVTNQDNKPQEGKVLITNGGIYVPKGITKLYECKRQLISYSNETYLKELKFSNLNFSGAANFDYETYYKEDQIKKLLLTYDGISNYRASLFSFNNTDNIVFQNCEFRNIGSYSAISVLNNDAYKGKGGFTFDNNKAYDMGGRVLQSYAKNTKITNNRIHRSGLFSFDRPDPLLVTSSEYEVANNTISDFTGNGMTIGYNMCSLVDKYPINGVVRENELYLTSDYLNYLERYTLEDTHAIYFVNHQTNSSCYDNIVHDFEGYKFTDGTGRCNNKAIVVDCGGYNVSIMRNLVYNVADLAFCVEYSAAHHAKSTTNINLKYNVFFAPYRFRGNPNFPESSSAFGNYIAVDRNGKYKSLLAGLQQIKQYILQGNEVTDENAEIKNGKCYLTKDISYLNLSPFVKSRIVNFVGLLSSNAVTSMDADYIWSAGQLICIRSTGKQTAAIYTLDGNLVRVMRMNNGNTYIPVTPGFYIVKLDNQIAKKIYVE